MRKILLILFLCIAAVSFAQNEQKLDSLLNVWRDQSKADKTRLKAIHDYAWESLFTKPDSAFYHAQQEYEFAKSKGLKKNMSAALNTQAVSFHIRSDIPQALEYLHKSLAIDEEMGNKIGIATTIANIARFNIDQGNYSQALESYQKALPLYEELGDKEAVAVSLNNIGTAYLGQGDYLQALEYYKKSQTVREELGNRQGIATTLDNIGTVYFNLGDYLNAQKYSQKSLAISKELGDKLGEGRTLSSIGGILTMQGAYTKALDYYQKALLIAQELGAKNLSAEILNNIGKIYYNQGNYEQALEHYQTSIIISQELGMKTLIATTLINIGDLFKNQSKYRQALKYCKNGLELAENIGDVVRQRDACACMYKTYKALDKGNEAMMFLEEMIVFKDSLKVTETTKKLQQMEFEKQVLADSLQQVEKELKVEIAHQKEKNKLTWGWGGSLSAVSIIALLVFRNVKQKQRKAEEERQKQIEEKEKILKDLELQTIDAMIVGQEKERQRLASDLHDSVGATLAAAKLQFNHLVKDEIDDKIRQELINKTSTLLEEAYVEIRSMAHLKNSGVMAKNGLLPAVKNLTDNASGINGLSFEIQSYGLEQRLDNSLEISIFRIIQELVTNIIKHANATKGIVYLTNHDNNLNVMIEDNGKGFNPKQIKTNKSGMGISSIDKRVGHLEGKLSIESEPNKGTTVIIDIPL